MDARALLRASKASASGAGSSSSASASTSSAQRQGAITDRFASYSSSTGSLRCSACSYLAIKHDALWSAHAASKSHRANAAAVLAKEEQEAAERRRKEEAAAAAAETEQAASGSGAKRKGEEANSSSKRQKTDAQSSAADDASLDPEWLAFKREVLDKQPANGSGGEDYTKYAAATIEAAPVLRGADGEDEGGNAAKAAPSEPELTEEELEEKRRAEQERAEKEEIMERYEEEVRIQQEGDER